MKNVGPLREHCRLELVMYGALPHGNLCKGMMHLPGGKKRDMRTVNFASQHGLKNGLLDTANESIYFCTVSHCWTRVY